MNTTEDKDIIVSVCANCGKEGDDVNNICNKCKQVKYCNAICKKKHRSKHKKECEEHERLAAELHDEKLFKEPPPQHGDCPICFILMPNLNTGWRYQACCGKQICNGCIFAPLYDDQGNEIDNNKCAFCRTRCPKSNEEMIEWLLKRMEVNDPIAFHSLGVMYYQGTNDYQQDYAKALKLFHRAAELGYSEAINSIGYAYNLGRGVERDEKKSIHYYELAAMGGNVYARYNLGAVEQNAGNVDRALKHYMIAVGSGHNESLKEIKRLYSSGHASKEDYTKALQSYQAYLGEIKSAQRDKAAATYEDCRYYY